MAYKSEEVLEALVNFNGWSKGAAKALGTDVRTLMVHVDRLKKEGKPIPPLRPSRVRYLPKEILAVVIECNGNRAHAAEILGIHERTIRSRLRQIEKAGIEVIPPPAGSGCVRADVTPEFIQQVRQWVEPKGWK